MTDQNESAPEADLEALSTEVEETEAPEAVDDTEGQDEGQPAKAKPEGEAEEKSEAAKRRERRKADTERRIAEAQAAKAQADRVAAELEARKEAAKKLPIPKQEQFDTYEDFQAQLSTYHTLQALDGRDMQKLEAEAKAHFETAKSIQAQQKQEDAQNWVAQMEDGRKRYNDFDAVALKAAPIDQRMAEQIMQSDNAADVAYLIGKNPALGHQMRAMDDIQLARAIGRLEAQASAPKPRTVTNAPDPINPVRGNATATTDPSKMSTAQYRAWRQAGGTF